jgi:asparagine synthase (glutamine-hydrolysing)
MKPILNPGLWQGGEDAWATGHLHCPDGAYYEGKQIIDYFSSAKDEATLCTLAKQANGCFGYICMLEGSCYAFMDAVRSYPLFYAVTPSDLSISDNTNNLQLLNASVLSNTPPDIMAEYLLTGYVTGNDTLIPSLYQIPAGHYLKWSKGTEPKLVQYYRFTHTEPDEGKLQDYLEKLDTIHLALAHRLTDSLQGRTAIVPLSGGYDSRLVAWLLKRVNYPKVCCFSYGTPNNPESRISKAVADQLGWDWRFVPHSRTSWYRAFQSRNMKDFFAYATNASSGVNIQDWLAVKVLHDSKIIPEVGVFVPGHTGDFVEGMHLPPEYGARTDFTREELINQIIHAHYNLWEWEHEDYYDAIAKRIGMQISIPQRMNAVTAASLFEEWEWGQRQAKSIVNSLRVYEFFGYGWRIPLWDKELLDFWSTVPLTLRYNRNLWNQYQKQYIKLPVPYLAKPPWSERIPNKLIRSTIGDIMDVRYGRFANPRNMLQFSLARVESLLNPEQKYPAFIHPKQRLLRSTINGLQALISISEV